MCAACGLRIRCKHGFKAVYLPKHKQWLDADGLCAVCRALQSGARLRVPKPVRTVGIVKRDRDTTSLEQLWSIPCKLGVLVICGVCHKVATDGHKARHMGSKYLRSEIRTNKCRYCKQPMSQGGDYCPVNGDRGCRRLVIMRKVRVPTCEVCTEDAATEYAVEPPQTEDDYRLKVLALWKRLIEEEGHGYEDTFLGL